MYGFGILQKLTCPNLSNPQKDKLYCFVDETGQDAGSKFFVVVAVLVTDQVGEFRTWLEQLEQSVRIGTVKWHKANYPYRLQFMNEFLRYGGKNVHAYFIKTPKPVFYYLPLIDLLQQATTLHGSALTQTQVCIDGLDKISAKKITNALRTAHRSIRLVRGVRDESEPVIRLADRLAGCIRMALRGNEECKALLASATKKGLLKEV